MGVHRAAAAVKANICNLGDDLLMDILSRLPPKRLAICKCVSKSWRHLVSTLIHSPTRRISGLVIEFVDRWNPSSVCLRIDADTVTKESLSFLPCHPDTRIFDCDNGFLLCSFQLLLDYPDHYYVCNPVTQQWVALPQTPKRSDVPEFDEYLALVMDKSSDAYYSHFEVFRFVILHEFDYEIDPSGSVLFVDVYSSRLGKWTKTKASFKCINFVAPSLSLDGLVFFLTCNPNVLMYDIKEEYLKELDLPPGLDAKVVSESHCLGVSEGCLSFAFHNGPGIKVWKMESDNIGEWVLKHSINFVDIGIPGPLPNLDKMQQEVLALHPNMDAIFVRKDDCIFCYDFNSKELEDIMRVSPCSLDYFFYAWVKPFSESLCPMADAQQRTKKRKKKFGSTTLKKKIGSTGYTRKRTNI